MRSTAFVFMAALALVVAVFPATSGAVTPGLAGLTGVLGEDGALRLAQPGIHGGALTEVATNVESFQLLDYRLGVLTSERALHLSENKDSVALAVAMEDVCAYHLGASAVGILTCDGTLWVRPWAGETEDGPIDTTAVAVAAGVQAFQLTIDRLAVLDGQGTLWLRTPLIWGKFEKVAGDVQAFQIALDGVAYLIPGRAFGANRPARNELHLARGFPSLGGAKRVATNVADFDLQARLWNSEGEGTNVRLQLAVIGDDGELQVGSANELAIQLKPTGLGSVERARWADTRLGVLTSDGRLTVLAVSPHDEPGRRDDIASGVEDFQLDRNGEVLVRRGTRVERFALAFDWTTLAGNPTGEVLREHGVLATKVALRPGALALASEWSAQLASVRPAGLVRARESLLSLSDESPADLAGPEPVAVDESSPSPAAATFCNAPNSSGSFATAIMIDSFYKAMYYKRMGCGAWESSPSRIFPPTGGTAIRIASLRWPDGNAGLVKIAENGRTYYQHFDPATMQWRWNWVDLGGGAKEVTAVAYRSKHADIFVVNGGTIYRRHATSSIGSWGPWTTWFCCTMPNTKLSATTFQGPLAATTILLGRSTDGDLYQRFGTTGTSGDAVWGAWNWSGLPNLGAGQIDLNFSTVALGNGTATVWAVRRHSSSWHAWKRHFNGSTWGGWVSTLWPGQCLPSSFGCGAYPPGSGGAGRMSLVGLPGTTTGFAAANVFQMSGGTNDARIHGIVGSYDLSTGVRTDIQGGSFPPAADVTVVPVMGHHAQPTSLPPQEPPKENSIFSSAGTGSFFLPVPRYDNKSDTAGDDRNYWAGIFFHIDGYDITGWLPVYRSTDRTSKSEDQWRLWCKQKPQRLECAPHGIRNYDHPGANCGTGCQARGEWKDVVVAREDFSLPGGKFLRVVVFRTPNGYWGDYREWSPDSYLALDILVGAIATWVTGPYVGSVLSSAGAFGGYLLGSAATYWTYEVAIKGRDPFDTFLTVLGSTGISAGLYVAHNLVSTTWTSVLNPLSGDPQLRSWIHAGAWLHTYAEQLGKAFCGKAGYESNSLDGWSWFKFGCWVHDIWVEKMGTGSFSANSFNSMAPAFGYAIANFPNRNNMNINQVIAACRAAGFSC